MISLEEVINEAEDRIGFGYDIINGESKIAEQMHTGIYVAYRYDHSEEEMWTFVTLDDKEKAKMLAEYWASVYCTDDDERQFREDFYSEGVDNPEEFKSFMKREFAEFNEKAAWDLPVRVGQSIAHSTTVGYAYIDDLILCMPFDVLRQFTTRLFDWSIITGFEEDH